MSVLDIDILMSNFQENIMLAKKFIKDNYTISNPDALQFREVDGEVVVDYDGYLRCSNLCLESLTNGKFRFGNVYSFHCSNCAKIKTLKGAPQECNIFNCSSCAKIKTLKGAPQKCGTFICSYCFELVSIEGAPSICDALDFTYCIKLTSLKGAPRECNAFGCESCDGLKSLKGAPEKCKVFNCPPRLLQK